MNIKTLIKGIPALIMTAIVGCGGSNSDSDTDPMEQLPVIITLGGSTAKGTINKGKVLAEELNFRGNAITEIGSAVTGRDGSYGLVVGNSYGGGPIQITVSADADTEMKCDVPAGCGARTDDIDDADTVIDFGEWYKPGNLSMRALVAGAENGDILSVSVTPFTDMAASRAMEAGSLNDTAVNNANSEVFQLLGGIDILHTVPLDITDPAAIRDGDAKEIAYSALSAATVILADMSSGSPDIQGVLAALSNSFTGGVMTAVDENDDDTIISLQELIDGSQSTFDQAGIADTSGVLAQMQSDVDAAVADGGDVDPDPGPDAGDTNLAKVKAFVTDVRTWGTVIEEEIRINRDTFSQQLDLASTANDFSMEFFLRPALMASIEALVMHFSGANPSNNLNDYEIGVSEDPQFTSGSITKTGGSVTITDGVILGVMVNITVQMPEDNSTVTNFEMGITTPASFESAAADIVINKGAVTVNLASPYFVDWDAIAVGAAVEPDFADSTIDVDLDVAMTQKQDSTGAALAETVVFAGSLISKLMNPVENAVNGGIRWMTPRTLTLTGNISSSGGHSFDADFTANIANADTFTPAPGPLEDETNWLDASLGLTFSLQMDGLPDASVNISGDRTAFDAGTATITINYGPRQIVIYGGFSSNTRTGSITITNQDGVSMSIEDIDMALGSAVLMYNGQSYGTLSEMPNGLIKITYSDGTFETL